MPSTTTLDTIVHRHDMAGIKNWFNEWYSKDTSRKIRAVNKAKGERGERLTTNVPYGYKHDSSDPKKWVIDEESAQVVKRIFALCMEGKGPSQIAALLEKEKVLNPTAYKQREGRKTPHQAPENEYRWHESTVAYILEYMEYTGCTVNFKTYSNSIYDKKQRENPMENRKIFYNTHPAIISLEVFDKVQEIRQQRHRRTATGKSNMFSGLVFCNDCKQKLFTSSAMLSCSMLLTAFLAFYYYTTIGPFLNPYKTSCRRHYRKAARYRPCRRSRSGGSRRWGTGCTPRGGRCRRCPRCRRP